MTFAIGSLVKARGREWVVLPESNDELLVLRPLGGTEDEVTGIVTALENIEPAQFDLPDPTQIGDYRSCRLLRDAVRLGFRSSAGPFRSFARIAVEPRPYQLVPLLVALKLDPVRVLIADDVGIGKTIEACLIARELIDRGEVKRLAVLCPPHLAEQWQVELRDKFHIDAELVLPSTAARLERHCAFGESLFEHYDYVIVSTDFIKSDRRRDEFLRTCPELVIVDEAHTCAFAAEGRGGKHQRHQLVAGIAADPDKHVILVTATPHSGKEEAFRSLLAFLSPDFNALPQDLTGEANAPHRRKLAQHFIQRRRVDIEHYMDSDTPFPVRRDGEETYALSTEYKKLFEKVVQFARETVKDPEGGAHRQRVRWWSALALLRALASSPAAAAATLRNRAATADTETVEEADEIGRRTVLDLIDDESAEGIDLAPGSDIGEAGDDALIGRRRLLEMAREAEALQGEKDVKLQKAVKIVKRLLKDGYKPILFCRFIPTAEYVAEVLREQLGNRVEVAAVTGTLPPAERETRVMQLAEAKLEAKQHVLVATDCLSEGINLQEHFDAVVHYDLSWNPTRHEQREGRVDRYGQPNPNVRVMTYYGTDNQIDGIILDVLLRKHKAIRNSLGISVPVPVDTDQLIEAIFEGLLLREAAAGAESTQLYLPGFEEFLKPKKDDLFTVWDEASSREKRSRTMFAQETIKVDEVARELHAAQTASGSGVEVAAFTKDAFRAHGAAVSGNGTVSFDMREVPRALADMLGAFDSERGSFSARFELPVQPGELYLSRTHPIVEGLATYVMDTALDPHTDSIAKRAGVIRTSKVNKRTTALLVRFRYHIITKRQGEEKQLLAEDCRLLAFSGAPESAEWLDAGEADKLLQLAPEANILPEQATLALSNIVEGFDAISAHLDEAATLRGEELLDAHRRVRAAANAKGAKHFVEPQLPPDVLGIYIYLPKG
ncbi:MAG: helicase-related protein [Actinomycetota bacterium]|nr:helicase-related protein [Actinomycetota bacterium]